MEKLCDFCSAISPVVYCKADSANLCLSCDAKVHSANNLFNRHLRTILCGSCRYRPACVKCLDDHQMFLCRDCDGALHVSSQHQKREIGSYTGCPSAKEFAALWGFELNDGVDNKAHLDGTISTCCGSSGDSSAAKVYKEVEENKSSTCFILHQILALGRLQLTEGNSRLLLVGGKKQSELSSSSSSVDHKSNRFDDKVDDLPLPFTQLENMLTSSTSGLPLQIDSFWPVQSSQLWAQNMQDIGVCEELVCDDDDFNIPDVDMTFQNFEELFGGDQDPMRPLLDDKDASYSNDKLDNGLIAGATREHDASEVSSSILFHQSRSY